MGNIWEYGQYGNYGHYPGVKGNIQELLIVARFEGAVYCHGA